MLYAQEINTAGQENTINGVVVSSPAAPVQFAHVENYSSKNIVITDREGRFSITASAGDTLIFSATGFLYRKVIVTDTLF